LPPRILCGPRPAGGGSALRRIVATGLATVLCGCAGMTGTGQAPSTAIGREGMLRTTLDNGLKVILVEDHSAPVAALDVWVRVGSADERPDQRGVRQGHQSRLLRGTGGADV